MKTFDVNRDVHVSSMENHCGIEIETVMRIRPLLKKERDDIILLEARKTTESNEIQTVILNPLNPSLSGNGSHNRARTDSDSTTNNVPTEYHFNHVLPENTSQDKIYYTIGLPIVTATMNSLKNATSRQSRDMMPRSHLLISMGVENSGKTYTCFGGMTIPKRRASQDGLVPRLLDSIFSQSNHAIGGSKGFTVQVSILQVSQPKGEGNSDPNSCQIHDLLAKSPQSSSSKGKMYDSSPKKKKNLNVRNIAARFERVIPSPVNRRTQKVSQDIMTELDAENLKPTFDNCRDITQAREILQIGFNKSQKHRTGDKNYHLYITMQPVIDGTKFGDSISILDMAGLEEKRVKQNIRGKQSVASSNQEANEAVLHCLKTMIHNVNIASSKTNASSYSDDEVSEISSVSQAKYPMRDQLKHVPFRRHKVTMILNKLFLQNSSVKVTFLLAAYPGHIDFQQKRMLLQDMEMLHGSTLAASSNVYSSREADSPNRMRIEDNNKNEVQKIRSKQRRTVKLATSFKQGQRSNNHPHLSNDRQNSSPTEKMIGTQTPRSAQRIPKVEPMKRNSRSIGLPAKPSAPMTTTQKQEIHASSESFGFVQQKCEPSAPALLEIQQPYNDSINVNESFVSDFPGVQIPASAEGKSDFTSESVSFPDPSSTRGTIRERPTAVGEEENDSSNFFQQKESASFPRKVETRKNFPKNQHEKLKSPLGRSRLENFEHVTAGKISPVQINLLGKEANRFPSNENGTPSYCFGNDFASQANDSRDTKYERNRAQNESNSEVKELEAKLKQSIKEKKAVEQICSQLEKENAELKNDAREAGRKVRQSRWTKQDEEEFLHSRKMRHEAQNIIEEPVYDHLEKVKYIYGIKNQWCMTNKKHFSLTLPNQFQRAPVLDIRDSKMLEEENEGILNFNIKSEGKRQNHNNSGNKKKGAGLTSNIRKSLTPPNRKSHVKSVEPPAGLSALKKLTSRRLKY